MWRDAPVLCINQQLGSQLLTLFPETLQNIITRFFHLINSVSLVKSEDYCSHCLHQSFTLFLWTWPSWQLCNWCGEREYCFARGHYLDCRGNTSNSNCNVCHTNVLMLQARRGYRHCSHALLSLNNFTQHWLLYLQIVNEWDWNTAN